MSNTIFSLHTDIRFKKIYTIDWLYDHIVIWLYSYIVIQLYSYKVIKLYSCIFTVERRLSEGRNAASGKEDLILLFVIKVNNIAFIQLYVILYG